MPSLEEYARYQDEIEALKSYNAKLQRQLAAAKAKTADLVRATLEGAMEAMYALGPIPAVETSTNIFAGQRGLDHEEVALWDLGDWQGGKETTTYNSLIMRERVERYWRKAHYITDIQRADHPVRKCTILLGGDMVEGLFQFPTQAFEVDSTIFAQFVYVSRLIVDTVRFALSVYDQVTVVAEWGNHGRIGSKRDTVPRADNIDRMCYEFARQLLAGESRLTWEDCPEDIQRVEIGNYRALCLHGDEIGRGGYVSRNTIIQHMNRWRSGAYPWEFRDVYIHHYHTHYEDTLANGLGSVFGTGSTESDNRYAREQLAASASPSQRLHFIDPRKGRVTAQYKIYLSED